VPSVARCGLTKMLGRRPKGGVEGRGRENGWEMEIYYEKGGSCCISDYEGWIISVGSRL
jgi:hypothetical protein